LKLDAETLARLPDLPSRARAIATSVLPGIHPSLTRGPAAELVDRRAYVPGDDPRRVDWRVYARTRQLLVRRARRDADLPVHLVVDASASMAFQGPRAPRSKLEHARLLAGALAYAFLQAGDRVGLLGFGRGQPHAVAPAGGGLERFRLIAAELERLEAGGSGDATHAVRALRPIARRRGVVAVISDLLPQGRALDLEPLARELRALAAHGHDVMVLQVRDPEEASLSLEGAHRFRDLETAEDRVVEAARVRAAYDARARAFEAEARGLGRVGRIDHALAATDASPAEPLCALLERRRRTSASRRRSA